jgi:hypothetical protein
MDRLADAVLAYSWWTTQQDQGGLLLKVRANWFGPFIV